MFGRTQLAAVGCVAVLLATVLSRSLPAVPPTSDRVLPQSTKGYFSIPNYDVLRRQWEATQIGRLMNEPRMEPFVGDLREQFQRQFGPGGDGLGVTLDDIATIAAGEVAVAVLLPAPDTAATVALIDVTGRRREVDEFVGKIRRELTRRRATVRQMEISGAAVTRYDLPRTGDRPGEAVLVAVREDVLVLADNAAELDGVLARVAAGGTNQGTLAGLASYQAVNERARVEMPELGPQLRWFAEPFGLADARRLGDRRTARRGTDLLKALRRQGFTAVQGLGGFVNFATDRHEVLHRTAIFAPKDPNAAEGEKYRLAARMMDFPNRGLHEPPVWVPRDVATYLSFNLRIRKAFDAAETLVDELAGEKGVFRDVLDSIKNDPDGPQVDIRADLVGNLGERVIVVTDYELPITPKSERVLVGVEASNPAALAKTINRVFESDPNAKRHVIDGKVVWEIIEEEADAAPPKVEIPDLGPAADPEPEERFRMPRSAVTVAHGYLLRATHIDFLRKVLAEAADPRPLSEASDFQRVVAETERLGAGEEAARMFNRTDESFRPTYELIRAGRMPEAETILGRVLNRVLGDDREGRRRQRIDGTKLPEFDTVRNSFGPGGGFIRSEPNGWIVIGFLLEKPSSIEIGKRPDAPRGASGEPAAVESEN